MNLLSVLTLILLASETPRYEVFDRFSAQKYKSGQELCESKSFVLRENGSFIRVPIDHQYPEVGSFSLYYRTEAPFDKSKPSVLVFNGGPGLGSHQGFFFDKLSYNVVLFDPRGVACSRPDHERTYRDPKFYSIENIAKDADYIRKHLGISQWSVYGVSFGTAPATVYSSVYPKVIKALVLEGVVYSGSNKLWDGSLRHKQIKRVLAKLTRGEALFLSKISDNYGVPALWFSIKARQFLALEKGEETFLKYLKSLQTQFALLELRREFIQSQKNKFNSIFEMDKNVFTQLACEELGLKEVESFFYETLSPSGRLQLKKTDGDFSCQAGLVGSGKLTYIASNYSVSAPVTYIHGEKDNITERDQAFDHYRMVPKGAAQLLIAKEGGHSPGLRRVVKGNTDFIASLEAAFRGDFSNQKKLKANEWFYTQK